MNFALEQREKCANLRELHTLILTRFPGIKLAYSTFTQELRKPHWSAKARNERGTPCPARNEALAASIQSTLEAFPTISCRGLARELGKPEATVRSYLHEVLKLDYQKTKWVPHNLTDIEKKSRRDLSGKLLEVVKAAEKDYYQFFITGDESWFFYTTPVQGMWTPRVSTPDSPETHTFCTKNNDHDLLEPQWHCVHLRASGRREMDSTLLCFQCFGASYENGCLQARQSRWKEVDRSYG